MKTKNRILTVSGIVLLIGIITALIIYFNFRSRIPENGVLVMKETYLYEQKYE